MLLFIHLPNNYTKYKNHIKYCTLNITYLKKKEETLFFIQKFDSKPPSYLDRALVTV